MSIEKAVAMEKLNSSLYVKTMREIFNFDLTHTTKDFIYLTTLNSTKHYIITNHLGKKRIETKANRDYQIFYDEGLHECICHAFKMYHKYQWDQLDGIIVLISFHIECLDCGLCLDNDTMDLYPFFWSFEK